MSSLPLVSVVIPTLNEEKYLPSLLGSLEKLDTPLDIIVVDGHSTDRTEEVAKEFSGIFIEDSSIKVIASNRGISLQRNTGAKSARGDIILFCDADIIIPSREIFVALISSFINGKYVVAAPILTPIESGVRIKLVYKTLVLIQRIFLFFKRTYLAGSCIITIKEVFERVEGFDERILLAEDIDYTQRVSLLGRSGLLPFPILVSARRVIKYGYLWIVRDIGSVVRLLVKGSVRPEKIFYPFGEFGGEAPYHVTDKNL